MDSATALVLRGSKLFSTDGPALHAPTSKATPRMAPTVWIHSHPGRTDEAKAEVTIPDLLREGTSGVRA